MDDLAKKGVFKVTAELREHLACLFDAGFASEKQTKEAIQATFAQYNYLIDPHTAVAKHVLDERIAAGSATGKAKVFLSTASPYKFARDVAGALGLATDELDDFACMELLAERTQTTPDQALSMLKTQEVLHKQVCDVAQMQNFVEAAAHKLTQKA